MRRKTIGFLVLTIVVVGGIVFVERRLRDAGGAEAWTDLNSSVYRVVLGGEPPPPTDDLAPPPPPGVGGSSRHGGGVDGGGHDGSRPSIGGDDVPHTRAPTRPPNSFRYVIRSGDVLSAIVSRHLGTASPAAVARVARDSGLANPNRISTGDELLIKVDVWEKLLVEDGETLHDVARRIYSAPGRTPALRIANPHLPPGDDRPIAAGTVIWVAR